MTAQYNGGSAIGQLCLCPEDVSSGMYANSTSSESSADSLLNMNNAYRYRQYPLSMQDLVQSAAMRSIPVEFDSRSFYISQDYRSKKSTDDKTVSPDIQLRRRAQNRASQKAFRDRGKKKITELEKKLAELKTLYTDLAQSYKPLQLECSALRKELANLQRPNSKNEIMAPVPISHQFSRGEWDESGATTSNPLLFDVSDWRDTTLGENLQRQGFLPTVIA